MPYAHSFDGTALWYDVRGHGGGVPVLLIAGNGCDHSVWNYVIDDFSAERPVIVYDHRGTGKSGSNFTGAWSTRDFARDAFAVLQAAGVARAHVYGHSMGGRVAQWFAVDRPDATGALIIGASSVGGKQGIPRSAEATKAMKENDTITLQALCYPKSWSKEHPEQAMSGAPNPHDMNTFLWHMRASEEHDSWDIALSITSPTLVIHGSEDGITHPGNSEILAARIPTARLLIVDKSKHVYWADHPEVHHTVSAFMKETERGGVPSAD
ncbi:alpha/beta hydrolase [Pectobacterium punjabense]|uniref:Alpha/beta hydrolase n=1 Tax=Pectobacterium punjabense TaxID=2108399 RepID=A0ABX6KXZ2_9GAMM|nr:alpha/beta hydrolase [Pectobacterium punjabense]MBS4430644.1 alpha/beta hydrolase [Pectobacterium punjabense]PTA64063.1 alpha/beta hydrolase [Pectobacterium punjabense]QJA18864.1 alpha/beta hydrolase [Pectobacterium punjabense]